MDKTTWQRVKLGEICSTIDYGYTTSATNLNTGVKFLRITDIVPNMINWDSVPYCEIDFDKKEKYLLEAGDIVIARTGATTGYNKIIKHNDFQAVFASYLIRYKINSNLANPYFIFYHLQSLAWKGFVEGIIGGSAQPNANAKQFADFSFPLPPLGTQHKIAEILSSLDDKIDLLHRQNKTLESLALTLFRHTFIENPKRNEWEEVSLEDICLKIQSGGTPSTKQHSYYGGNINWYSTKELNDNFLFKSIQQITDEGLNHSSAKLFPKDSVIIAIYASPTVGSLGILTQESAFNQAACGLIVDETKSSKEFVFLFLKNERENLNLLASGSAQQNLNVEKIKNYPLLLPDKKIFNDFQIQAKGFFDKISLNTKEILSLQQMRDLLLKKIFE